MRGQNNPLIDFSSLMRKKASLREELIKRENLLEKRIAVLGGSTTAEIVDQLEIFLLSRGIKAIFYQSDFNRYYEDALFSNEALLKFKPDLVYIHTTVMNIMDFPSMISSSADVENWVEQKQNHFRSLWQGVTQHLDCPILQNNVEEPWCRPLGNLDGSDYRGRSRLVARLNEFFAKEAQQNPRLHINDIHYLSARLGIDQWFSPRIWYLYKYAIDMEMIPHLTHHLAAVIAALWGKTNKCLVMDLDNTLWGGVIGDDGLDGIQLGSETPEAEAYSDFQRYVRAMKERGILIAVCSKNDDVNARAGFTHPDSLLKQEDFAIFKANWEPKSQNIEAIANELNIGVDSLVFVDDNPAEREIVRAQLPAVSVPDMGSDITEFIHLLDQAAHFETPSLSQEDVVRSGYYRDNTRRTAQQAQFASYDEFLASLDMVAEIAPFQAIFMERIAQLTNKTNQFNLTTRRYTQVEIENMAASDKYITLYGRLQDRFGDNGLISVVAGEIRSVNAQQKELHLDLWLMSCRVLKRGMEFAMLEELCRHARLKQLTAIIGYYLPTPKNDMVKNFYAELGFRKIKETNTEVIWKLDLLAIDKSPVHFIKIKN